MKLPLLLTALALAPFLRAADDKKETAPAKETEKSAEPKPEPKAAEGELPRVSAGDIEGVKKLIGKKAVVFGKVTGTGEAKSGISFLNMEGSKFTVVTFKENFAKFEGGQSPAKLYKGKEVEVTGEIFEYRKTPNSSPQPEIKLTDPAQIKIVEATKDAKDSKDAKESKEEKPEAKEDPKRVPAKKYFR